LLLWRIEDQLSRSYLTLNEKRTSTQDSIGMGELTRDLNILGPMTQVRIGET
jgi:hypothetical protein